MKKIFHFLLSLLIALVGSPLSALASTEIFTPPMYVSVLELNKQVMQLKEDVLNQERANRDEEISVRALAQKNADMAQKLQASDFFTNIDTMRQLKEVMDHYGRQLDEHNRLLMARNEETRGLRQRIEKLEHLFDPVIYLNKDVEAMKSLSSLASDLKEQKISLVAKNQSLVEKNQQLLDLKAQLVRAQEELKSTKSPSTIDDNLKPQIKRIKEYQKSLKDKDAYMMQLEDKIIKRDGQIIELKAKLVDALKQLVKAQKDLAVKDKTIQRQQEAIEDLHQDINEIQQSVSGLQKDFSKYDGGFDGIDTNIKALKNQLVQAQVRAGEADGQGKELVQLKGDVAALNYQVQTSQEDLGDYQTQVKKLNDAVDGLTAQVSTKDKDLQQKNEQINQLKEQVQKTAGYKDMIKKVQAHLADLTGQMDGLKADVGSLLHVKANFKLSLVLISKYHILEQLAGEKCDLLIQLVKKRQDRTEYFRDQLKNTISYWQELNQKNTAQLESMLDVYQKQADEKESNAKNMTQERVKLQADLQVAQENLEQNQKDLKKVQDYFYELEQKYSTKTKELRDKSQEVALLSEVSDQQKQDVAALLEKLTVAEAKLKTSVDQSELEKTKQMLKASSDELDALKSSLKNKDEQMGQLKKQSMDYSDMRKNLQMAKDKVSKLMEEVYLKEKEVERLKMQGVEKDKSIATLTEDLKKSDQKLLEAIAGKEISKIRQALADTREQLKNFKELLKDKEAAMRRMQDDHTQVDILKTRLNQARAQIQDAKDTAKKAIDQAKEDPSKKTKIQQLTMMLEDKNQMMAKLAVQLKEKTDAYAHQQKEMEELKAALKKAGQQVHQVSGSVKVIEKIHVRGQGNEGYLIRDGKDTSTMTYEVSQQIKILEDKVQKANQDSETYKAEYAAAQKELDEARLLLQKCQSNLATQTLFPHTISKNIIVPSDPMPGN